MSVRYIGSKARVADAIVELAGPPLGGRFIDAFSGTGSVAAAAAKRGWRVTVNDSLPSAVAMSVASTLSSGNVNFSDLGGYETAVELLNTLPGSPGFLYETYSPASAAFIGTERRYFTEANAARLDAMRSKIREWSDAGYLSWVDEQLLLADLMQAANRVANIAGTYGCFLRDWSSTALRDVTMRTRTLRPGITDVRAVVGDVFTLSTEPHDTVYFDPPYTKRQYGAYYHLLETLHAGDTPSVTGVTGLRPWRHTASDFCYRTRALEALTRLVFGTAARKVLLSYSNEGHVPLPQLVNALSKTGQVTLHELQRIGRYRPNARASKAGDTVEEFLIEIQPVKRVSDSKSLHAPTVLA